ncbi:pilus assembly protein [Parasulfuritortus cantonensis]|uniref:Pilus assembly protein n=1 Tax=Parasulfuritortus cantonensis TaxID=2528202 RepID=A0A4R1BKR6_9PROT|nr:TadE/TadG family type IV pilus assembly protein [Parasulfuritortus cantonensis]TCJ17980.1 pilus assembly protein [Parasulfuritortus cantonensis]
MNDRGPQKLREGRRTRQRGAAAVEFALVFVLFFMVMYGAIAYGVVFALRHTFTQAVNEGARAALQDVGDIAAREALALSTATTAVSWLGARAPTPVVNTDCVATTAAFTCVKVTITYDYAANPIIPAIPGLGIVLPDTLTAQAVVQIS